MSSPLCERALSLVVACTVTLVATACATLERPDETLTRLSGGYFSVEDRSEVHQQGGMTLAVRHAGASGHRGGAVISWLRGHAEESGSSGGRKPASIRPPNPGSPPPAPIVTLERPPYVIFSAGASFGYERRYIGLEMGAHVLFSTGRSLLPMPWLNFKLGDLSSVWGELKLGSEGGVTDPMWMSAGIGFKSTWIRGRVGIGLGLRPTVDSFDRDRDLEIFDRGEPVLAGWAELTWNITPGFGVWLRAAGDEDASVSVEVGLVLTLADLFGAR